MKIRKKIMSIIIMFLMLPLGSFIFLNNDINAATTNFNKETSKTSALVQDVENFPSNKLTESFIIMNEKFSTFDEISSFTLPLNIFNNFNNEVIKKVSNMFPSLSLGTKINNSALSHVDKETKAASIPTGIIEMKDYTNNEVTFAVNIQDYSNSIIGKPRIKIIDVEKPNAKPVIIQELPKNGSQDLTIKVPVPFDSNIKYKAIFEVDYTVIAEEIVYDWELGNSILPIAISKCNDLVIMDNQITKYHDDFFLKNDIDCNNIEVYPIGDTINEFSGTLNGRGYSISNLKIDVNEYGVGLFGSTNGVFIENLGITSGEIKSSASSAKVGSFIGISNNSALKNVYSNINVIAESKVGNVTLGGLIGTMNKSNIYESYFAGKLLGNNNIGGIAGLVSSDSLIKETYSYGKISGSNNNIGGLVGQLMTDSSLQNSFSIMEITTLANPASSVDYIVGNKAGRIINSWSTEAQVINNVQPKSENTASLKNVLELKWYTNVLEWKISTWLFESNMTTPKLKEINRQVDNLLPPVTQIVEIEQTPGASGDVTIIWNTIKTRNMKINGYDIYDGDKKLNQQPIWSAGTSYILHNQTVGAHDYKIKTLYNANESIYSRENGFQVKSYATYTLAPSTMSNYSASTLITPSNGNQNMYNQVTSGTVTFKNEAGIIVNTPKELTEANLSDLKQGKTTTIVIDNLNPNSSYTTELSTTGIDNVKHINSNVKTTASGIPTVTDFAANQEAIGAVSLSFTVNTPLPVANITKIELFDGQNLLSNSFALTPGVKSFTTDNFQTVGNHTYKVVISYDGLNIQSTKTFAVESYATFTAKLTDSFGHGDFEYTIYPSDYSPQALKSITELNFYIRDYNGEITSWDTLSNPKLDALRAGNSVKINVTSHSKMEGFTDIQVSGIGKPVYVNAWFKP